MNFNYLTKNLNNEKAKIGFSYARLCSWNAGVCEI